jgi:hypothetical protein
MNCPFTVPVRRSNLPAAGRPRTAYTAQTSAAGLLGGHSPRPGGRMTLMPHLQTSSCYNLTPNLGCARERSISPDKEEFDAIAAQHIAP